VLSLKLGSLFEPPENEVVALADAPRINMGGVGAMEKLLTPRSGLGANLRSVLEPAYLEKSSTRSTVTWGGGSLPCARQPAGSALGHWLDRSRGGVTP
jgi:hypothetical protein